jgi:hypothetical protein
MSITRPGLQGFTAWSLSRMAIVRRIASLMTCGAT